MVPKTASEMISFFGWDKHMPLMEWAAIPSDRRPYPCNIGSRTQRDVANLGHAIETGLAADALVFSGHVHQLGDVGILGKHADLMRLMRLNPSWVGKEKKAWPDLGPSISWEE